MQHVALNAKSDVLNPHHQVNRQEVIRAGMFALVSNWIKLMDNGNSKSRLPMVVGLFNANVGIQEYVENLASK